MIKLNNMKKILGLDLGTNSIGWAVVETEDNKKFELLDKGVRIFQEGVKIEKGIESSKAAERTGYRSARRIKFRRRLRKIETLKVLIENNMCPLSMDELIVWKENKNNYPKNKIFYNWLKTKDPKEGTNGTYINPYYFRTEAIKRKLENTNDVGRALYHLAQRRGFKSNRLESTDEKSRGIVKTEINKLSSELNGRYLGEYFYELYLKGEKIRKRHISREEHYLNEFKKICEVQNFNKELAEKLERAIFYQRPLKSQKGLVGKCTLQNNKHRCPISRPEFEEFRMWQFINSIKYKNSDGKFDFLNKEQRENIIPAFVSNKNATFEFSKIEKILNKGVHIYQFNYKSNHTIGSNQTMINFMDVFDIDRKLTNAWLLCVNKIYELYTAKTKKDGSLKSKSEVITDVWHVLFTFDNEENLKEFARNKLLLDESSAQKFSKINLKQDYSQLSLKAINKILPYLQEGLIYSYAVFIANIENVIGKSIWNIKENQQIIRTSIKKIIDNHKTELDINTITNSLINDFKVNYNNAHKEYKVDDIDLKNIREKIIKYYGNKTWNCLPEDEKLYVKEKVEKLYEKQLKSGKRGIFIEKIRLDDRIENFLKDNFDSSELNLKKLYHPSDVSVYKSVKITDLGLRLLGSPMIPSIKNPMAMRAMHQLRKLINHLIIEGVIDDSTIINVEMSRELNDANMRKAIERYQRQRATENEEFKTKIKELYKKECGTDFEPNNDDIMKYRLWEEQNHKCLYTGKSIGICDFIGSNPAFEIEHTIPRSLSYDNSLENKTLCEKEFNQQVKKNRIPFELSNYKEIISRINNWEIKAEELFKQIQKVKIQSRMAATKEIKDNAIQRKHLLQMEFNYWNGKLSRFTREDVPEGFKNSQLVDIGIITKYARAYLKTVFNNVNTVKGSTVAEFRNIWGLQEYFEKKDRSNHIHHCIDAITIACLTKDKYDFLAHLYHLDEQNNRDAVHRAMIKSKPWENFVQDVKEIENQILVSHYTPDNLPKQSKKILRKRGKIQKNENGDLIYEKGDAVRGSLHKESFYGAIKREIINKKGETEEKVLYVKRKPLEFSDLGFKTISELENIVDDAVRDKVLNAVKDKGLKQALNEPIWMNEEKQIPIKKVRCYTPSVTNPINLKKHRDKSKHEYKQSYHVTNDGNYLMVIYEGKDSQEKVKRDYEIVSNLQAGEYFKQSVHGVLKAQGINNLEGLIPKFKESGKNILPLKYILKTGTMVIFWENYPEEIWDIDKNQLYKRLFKVTQFESDGRIQARFHQIAKPDNELTKVSELDFSNIAEKIRLSKGNLNMLVNGYDFKINVLGHIEKLS
ncbi:MAG: hypothetical protein A2X13_02140 [Bacteroidetes bacterium GWC2_33_15]|nr:MAG: hypothetical protein A2X10_07485 [Bacteroidetes bacterium GWA2_33_15]OFX52276.1 MAG: hypothetical protein A2X13_02140 [Bacteroidetes bacterium GWC2_33_15]OFX64430.1 MAG: hypothetical protein A2X15_12960 [Bacteroidetes bacterium GWB2_32_14]OFX67835.1 MAG: hypothetical protein A2X14_06785 [Bacteroidetes bacterium GWD2_33_33]